MSDDQGTPPHGVVVVRSDYRLPYSKGLMAQSVPVIVRAMESVGVRRLVFTSAFGVGEQRGDPPLPLPTRMVKRIYIALILKRIFADKAVGERILMASTLDWTIVHPTMLTNGPRTGRYRAGEHLPLRGIPRISRADTADFLLSQLDDRTYVRKIVVVSD